MNHNHNYDYDYDYDLLMILKIQNMLMQFDILVAMNIDTI